MLLVFSAGPADADILSRLLAGAERAGAKVARSGGAQLDDAAAIVRKLEVPGRGVALAADVGSDGHWTLVNKAGEKFTAGSADELKRAIPALVPGGLEGGQRPLVVVLSERSLFGDRAVLKQLPAEAELHVAWGTSSLRLVAGPGGELMASVRRHLVVLVDTASLFREALWQLERPLNRSNIRVIALDPAGPDRIAAVPRVDPPTKRALSDRIAPQHLVSGLLALKGQTAVVTGRVAGENLVFRAGGGGEQALSLTDLRRAAGRGDVNLLVLDTPAPRQPGVRNWLWQRATVRGLDDALQRASMADFISSVAASNNAVLKFTIAPSGAGRVSFRAEPLQQSSLMPKFGLDEILTDVVAEVTGQVITTVVSGEFRNGERQRENDLRIIPGISSDLQFAYLLGMVAGLFGLSTLRLWWRRIWPAEQRADYSGAAGFHAARLARLICFIVVFLPLAGVPAALVALGGQILAILLLPVTVFSWIMRRVTAHRAT